MVNASTAKNLTTTQKPAIQRVPLLVSLVFILMSTKEMELARTALGTKTASKTVWSVRARILAPSVPKITSRSTLTANVSAEATPSLSSTQLQTKTSASVKTGSFPPRKAA